MLSPNISSPNLSCAYYPSIDSVDTTPQILELDSNSGPKNEPIAVRRSTRARKQPEILTYKQEVPSSRTVSKANKLKDFIEKEKKTKKAKKTETSMKATTDKKTRPNPWAMRQAWLNKIKKLRQDPEFIKRQQAIVSKFKSEYRPYVWNKDLSNYENLYRSEIFNNPGKQHPDIIKSINNYIKNSMPIRTSPLSQYISPQQLNDINKTNMEPEKALKIIQELTENSDLIEVMKAYKAIERLPSSQALPIEGMEKTSLPIVDAIPISLAHDRVMAIVQKYLYDKYKKPENKKFAMSQVIKKECSHNVSSDALLTNLEQDILTDKDILDFENEVRNIVMGKNNITDVNDPRIQMLIEEHMRNIPQLTNSDLDDNPPFDSIDSISDRLQKITLEKDKTKVEKDKTKVEKDKTKVEKDSSLKNLRHDSRSMSKSRSRSISSSRSRSKGRGIASGLMKKITTRKMPKVRIPLYRRKRSKSKSSSIKQKAGLKMKNKTTRKNKH